MASDEFSRLTAAGTVECTPDADAPIEVEFRGGLVIAAKTCVQPDIVIVLLVEQIPDSGKHRDLPVSIAPDIADREIGQGIGFD